MTKIAVWLATVVVLLAQCHAEMTLTLVDDAPKQGAVCLDGTAPGYYIRKATLPESATKWVLHIQGGGWCYKEIDCAARAKTALGSSTFMGKTLTDGGPLHENATENPVFYSWNHVEIAYCDGASFSGDRADPIVVGGTTLYFRGYRVLQAVIADLLQRQGMRYATDVFLSGCSAGGLSTYLHADQIHEMLPTNTRFKAAPFSGLFLHQPNAEGVPVYQTQLQYVFTMQNASAGVPQACLAAQKSGEEWRCIFAEEVHPFIKSPFFLMNSAYDSWSAMCIFAAEPVNPSSSQNGNCSAAAGWRTCLNGKKCTTSQITQLNTKWGDVVRSIVSRSAGSNKAGNGAYIYSCFAHCSESYQNTWSRLKTVYGVLMRDAVTKWWFSNNEPAAAHTYGDCSYSGSDFCCNPVCCQ